MVWITLTGPSVTLARSTVRARRLRRRGRGGRSAPATSPRCGALTTARQSHRSQRLADGLPTAQEDATRNTSEAHGEHVVLRIDRGPKAREAQRAVRGARAVAERGVAFSRLAPFARAALANGAAGLVVARHGRLLGVAGFTNAR
jgi:hypothetical protein